MSDYDCIKNNGYQKHEQGNKNVVYQHTSYAEGGENELYEVIKKVAAGESINKE